MTLDKLLGSAICIFTSACCTSRLARGNGQEQTHSETSSNYLCTSGLMTYLGGVILAAAITAHRLQLTDTT